MREIILHDTLSGELAPLRAARPRTGRDLCLRPDRLQPHPHRQRPALRRLQPAASASSSTRATSRRSSSTSPTSTTRSMTPRAARRLERGARGGDDRRTTAPTPTRWASAAPTTSRSPRETIAAIVDYIDALLDARPCLCGRRRRLLPRPLRRGLRQLSHRPLETWTRARAWRAPSARRIRSTSPCGRRTRRARTPPGRRRGARAAGLAHRVLGDGRGAPRRRLRHPRRRLGPRLPPPRERGRPDPRRPRRGARAPVDAQRHDPVHGREDGQVGRQHRAAARGARSARAADASSCTSSPATTASRSRSPRRRCSRRQRT